MSPAAGGGDEGKTQQPGILPQSCRPGSHPPLPLIPCPDPLPFSLLLRPWWPPPSARSRPSPAAPLQAPRAPPTPATPRPLPPSTPTLLQPMGDAPWGPTRLPGALEGPCPRRLPPRLAPCHPQGRPPSSEPAGAFGAPTRGPGLVPAVPFLPTPPLLGESGVDLGPRPSLLGGLPGSQPQGDPPGPQPARVPGPRPSGAPPQDQMPRPPPS